MRLLLSVIFYLFIGLSTAKASLIDYEFNTLIFSDNDHQVTGGFTLDSDTNELVAISVSLMGSIYNIDFDIGNLSLDGFSITFDNMTFGDNADEGFSLNEAGDYLVTGEYGYGPQDTCFFGATDICTGNLFTFQQVSQNSAAVDAPGASYLFAMGLILLFRRKMFS